MPEPKLLDPPRSEHIIVCPSCTHPLSTHTAEPHKPHCNRDCACRWTPNQIASNLIFGDLTPTQPKSMVRRPDGSWVDPDDWS